MKSAYRHAGGKRDGMLFGDTDVVKPTGKLLRKGSEPRTVFHTGADHGEFIVLFRSGAQKTARAFRKRVLGGAETTSDAVVITGVFLRFRHSLPLLCFQVKKDRGIAVFQIGEQTDEGADVVSVEDPDVFQPDRLDHRRFVQTDFERTFHSFQLSSDPLLPDRPFGKSHRSAVALFGRDPGKKFIKPVVVHRDGHAVIVDDHDKLFRLFVSRSQCLEIFAVEQRGVSHDVYHVVIFPEGIARSAEPQTRRNGISRMSGAENVVLAFRGERKAA